MGIATGSESIVRFGRFALNLRTRELFKDGSIIRLRGHPIEVLVVLVQHPGELVTRETLQKELWPGSTFVSFEQILNNSVVKLRNALSDQADSPKFIETLPRLGYRFIATVTLRSARDLGDVPAPLPANGRESGEDSLRARTAYRRPLWVMTWLVLVLLVAGALVTAKLKHSPAGRPRAVHRIAVLPLANISADPQQEYFADGMTEQLITELAHIKAWEVISRTSVMPYKATNKSMPQIARELSADWIIEGTVQRFGGRVHITAQLIDAERDTHLWSGSFERDLSDVLALQDELARAISSEARLTLTAQEGLQIGAAKKVNPKAYDAFLTGRYFLERGEYVKAVSEFEKAVVEDPQFAAAYAYLYEADGSVTFYQDLPFSTRALNAAHRAMELDKNLAESQVSAGDYRFYGEWDWSACDGEFRRGVELDPHSTDATLHYALCLRALGRTDAALAELQRGLHLDPVSPWLNLHLLRMLFEARRSDDALAQFRKMIDINVDSAHAYACAADIFESLHRDSEAIEAHHKADGLTGFNPEEMAALDRAAAAGGLRGYWQQRLALLVERSQRIRVSPMEFADMYASAGDDEKAIDMLQEAYRQHIPRMVWIKTSRRYDALRTSPKFQSLLHQMHYPE